MTSPGTIAVVGAGVAGLAAALQLRAKANVVVFEASGSAGGRVQTSSDNGYLLEWGPNSFLGSAQHLFSLIDDLSLGAELLPASPEARKRYVYHRKALRTVPMGPLSFATSTLLSPFAKLRIFLEPFVAIRETPHETVYDFFTRRFGPRVAERLVAPFVSGIYAGDAHELEMESAFPRIVALERKFGSVLEGGIRNKPSGPRRRGTFSFVKGMQTLTDACSRELGDCLRLNTAVVRITRETDSWILHTDIGEEFSADHIVLAVTAQQAARLLANSDLPQPFPTVAGLLATVPYASVGLVHFGVATQALPRALDGFGFLTVPHGELPILGSLWPSTVFPERAPNGKSLMTVFLGGRSDPTLSEKTSQERIETARSAVERALGGPFSPELAESRWINRAIPQFTRGHRRKLERVQSLLRGSELSLAGNYVSGVSIEAAIESGVRVDVSSRRQFVR